MVVAALAGGEWRRREKNSRSFWNDVSNTSKNPKHRKFPPSSFLSVNDAKPFPEPTRFRSVTDGAQQNSILETFGHRRATLAVMIISEHQQVGLQRSPWLRAQRAAQVVAKP